MCFSRKITRGRQLATIPEGIEAAPISAAEEQPEAGQLQADSTPVLTKRGAQQHTGSNRLSYKQHQALELIPEQQKLAAAAMVEGQKMIAEQQKLAASAVVEGQSEDWTLPAVREPCALQGTHQQEQQRELNSVGLQRPSMAQQCAPPRTDRHPDRWGASAALVP